MVDRLGTVFLSTFIAIHLGACAKRPEPPEIPLLEPGLWIFEIETRREGQPVETRTIRDCVGLRGLYSADRPADCSRIESRRSPDGKTLIVEVACGRLCRSMAVVSRPRT